CRLGVENARLAAAPAQEAPPVAIVFAGAVRPAPPPPIASGDLEGEEISVTALGAARGKHPPFPRGWQRRSAHRWLSFLALRHLYVRAGRPSSPTQSRAVADFPTGLRSDGRA